jgi:nucleoside-diphosphate kinase
MKNESALVLIKPDGLQKCLAGNILNLFMASRLKLKGLKLVQVSRGLAESHYGHLRRQHFFPQIVSYLTGRLHKQNPVMVMVFSGPAAIAKCRRIAGATNPEEADPQSVRGKFGRVTTKGVYENLVHVSSDAREARREIRLWFKRGELL